MCSLSALGVAPGKRISAEQMLTSSLRRCKELDERLAQPPLVLPEQHAAKLGERIGRRIVQHPEDRLAVVDRHYRIAVVAGLELLGDVVEVGPAEQR